MHINAKGTVRLDPKNRADRTALHVLNAMLNDPELAAVIEPHRGRGHTTEHGFDSSTLEDDPYAAERTLDFFSRVREITPKIVVFEYAEREVPDDLFYEVASVLEEKEPSEDPGDFVPGKVYAVAGEDEDA